MCTFFALKSLFCANNIDFKASVFITSGDTGFQEEFLNEIERVRLLYRDIKMAACKSFYDDLKSQEAFFESYRKEAAANKVRKAISLIDKHCERIHILGSSLRL